MVCVLRFMVLLCVLMKYFSILSDIRYAATNINDIKNNHFVWPYIGVYYLGVCHNLKNEYKWSSSSVYWWKLFVIEIRTILPFVKVSFPFFLSEF